MAKKAHNVVTVEISSYAGISAGATHFYAHFSFYDPDGEYPLERFFGEPDWNDGEGNPDKTYGYSFVIGDKAGSKIEFDSTPGKEKIIIEHGITHDKITFENDGIKRESGSIDKSHL